MHDRVDLTTPVLLGRASWSPTNPPGWSTRNGPAPARAGGRLRVRRRRYPDARARRRDPGVLRRPHPGSTSGKKSGSFSSPATVGRDSNRGSKGDSRWKGSTASSSGRSAACTWSRPSRGSPVHSTSDVHPRRRRPCAREVRVGRHCAPLQRHSRTWPLRSSLWTDELGTWWVIKDGVADAADPAITISTGSRRSST